LPFILEHSCFLHDFEAAGQEDARASEKPFEGHRLPFLFKVAPLKAISVRSVLNPV
jgi:hypothetical protein